MENVKDFRVENEHGILEYFSTVDLTGVNLETAISMDVNGIEVYGDAYATTKPA